MNKIKSLKGYGLCPYNDENVKYPLGIDKSKIPYNNNYILLGGVQVMEMMEKEFSLSWIKTNQNKLHLNDSQILKLEWWIKHDWNIYPVMNEFGLKRESENKRTYHNTDNSRGMHVKSLFYNYKGLCKKLLKVANLKPIIDNDNINFLYSFINHNYFVIDYSNYKIIKIHAEDYNPIVRIINDIKRDLYIFKKENNKLILVDQSNIIYYDIRNMFKITKKLIYS